MLKVAAVTIGTGVQQNRDPHHFNQYYNTYFLTTTNNVISNTAFIPSKQNVAAMQRLRLSPWCGNWEQSCFTNHGHVFPRHKMFSDLLLN